MYRLNQQITRLNHSLFQLYRHLRGYCSSIILLGRVELQQHINTHTGLHTHTHPYTFTNSLLMRVLHTPKHIMHRIYTHPRHTVHTPIATVHERRTNTNQSWCHLYRRHLNYGCNATRCHRQGSPEQRSTQLGAVLQTVSLLTQDTFLLIETDTFKN